MSTLIICSGGGIKAAAFTMGAMQVIGVDKHIKFIGKSGSCWAVEAISKLGSANAAESWLLANFDRSRKVYKKDWAGIIRNRNFYHYGPLLKTLEKLPKTYRIPAEYVVFNTTTLSSEIVTASPQAAIHSSSILGLFPQGDGKYCDVGSRGMGYATKAELREHKGQVIFLDAYNKEEPVSGGIIDGLSHEIEAGIAWSMDNFAGNLLESDHHIKYPWEEKYDMTIRDFKRDLIMRGLEAGRVAAREVLG